MLERAAAWLPLIALLALLPAARASARRLQHGGKRVMVIDWSRPTRQLLYDTLLVAVAVVWFLLLVAEAWPLSLAWLPGWLTTKLIDAVPAKIVGALLLVAVPPLYAAALRSLGESWRMGIDRDRPGPLKTTGAYAWSRNPIYTAFFLMIFGTCLIHGRVVVLLVGVALILLIHGVVLREEKFLTEQFGDQFRAYRKQVGRYVPWI